MIHREERKNEAIGVKGLHTKGIHVCTFSHKGESKHSITGSKDIVLFFPEKETFYMVPEMILHYLEDGKAHGWNPPWVPDADFVEAVMTAKQVDVMGEEQAKFAGARIKHVGYLTTDNGKIIDTRGGDANIGTGKVTPTTFGEQPQGLLEKMKVIYEGAVRCDEAAWHGKSYQSTITLKQSALPSATPAQASIAKPPQKKEEEHGAGSDDPWKGVKYFSSGSIEVRDGKIVRDDRGKDGIK